MSAAEDFFKRYNKDHPDEGISGVAMNRPVNTNMLPGQLGLELEVEGRRLPSRGNLEKIKGEKTGAMWETHEDGSLRGESKEYVLSAPCSAEELPGLVNGLYETFKLMDTRLDLSNRCSTHVHVNISGCKVNTITSIIALWATLEDVVIPWCGEERTTNHFCLSTKDASATLIPTWDRYLSGAGPNFGREMKYSALNILPIFDRGSVEFRCGPLPTDAGKVIAWTRLCESLVSYAKERLHNPILLASVLSERGGDGLLRDICETQLDVYNQLRLISGDPTEKMLSGFRRAQRICMGHPWDRWMDMINKEYVPDPFAKAKTAAPRQRIQRFNVEPRQEAPTWIPEPPEVADAPARINEPAGQNNWVPMLVLNNGEPIPRAAAYLPGTTLEYNFSRYVADAGQWVRWPRPAR